MQDSERWFCLALGIWLLGCFAYFVPAATWNPVSRFDLTRAIVEQHTFMIDEYVDDTGDRSFANGHWYTDKAPVPSLAAVPPYALFASWQRFRGERLEYSVVSTPRMPAMRVSVNGSFARALYVCSVVTAGAGTAIIGVLLFLFLVRRFSPKAALFGTVVTILGTPLFPYATSFYGHAVAGAFLVAALYLLLAEPQVAPGSSRVRLAGLCLVLAAGSEYIVVLPAAVVAGAFLATSDGRARRVVDLGAGAALPLLVIAAYHTACFGAPWRTGYSFLVRPEFVRGHASGFLGLHLPTSGGLYGILFGPERGLFFLSPVTALAFGFGAARALRRTDRAATTVMAAFVVLMLANGGYYMWWGGAAAGPRHLVPVIGFLAFGLAAAWESRAAPLAVVLAAVSIANALVLTGVGLEAPDHGDALFDYAYHRLAAGEIAALPGASNLGLRLGLARAASLGPLLVWLLLGARFLFRRVDRWMTPVEEGEPVLPADEGRLA
jgi:hypothetical protein